MYIFIGWVGDGQDIPVALLCSADMLSIWSMLRPTKMAAIAHHLGIKGKHLK